MLCILWHFVVKYNLKLYHNFAHKGDKATMQILNLKTKTTKSKHSIHIISLPQTISADFVFLLQNAYIYQYFLIPVQSFSACTFSRIVDCFQCKLSTVWSYIFLLNGPDKKPKQNNTHSNKKPRVHVRRRTAVSQCNETFLARCHRDFALIGQFALPIVFSGI